MFLIHFQYLASKACLEKGGEAVSYIDFARPWIFDAYGVFLGILRNSMTLLTPLKSKFAKLWEATYPPWVNTLIIPKFGGGGAKFGRGGGDEVS